MSATPFSTDSQIPKWLKVLQLSFFKYECSALTEVSELSKASASDSRHLWLYCSQNIFGRIPVATPSIPKTFKLCKGLNIG